MRPNRTVGIRMRDGCRSVLQGLLILLVAVVFGVAPALAQAPAAKKEPAATKPVAATAKAEPVRTAEPAAKPPGGPQEGIKVHGHWVIEVRNPDGTLVARREFTNKLVSDGALALVRLLSRSSSVGRWVIDLDGGSSLSSPPSPCSGAQCVITEGTGAVLFASQVPIGTDLTVVPNFALHKLDLKGSGTVPANGTVGRVLTGLALCPDSVAPQSPCQYTGPTNGFVFTVANAPADFAFANVAGGQIVQITVTFTFS